MRPNFQVGDEVFVRNWSGVFVIEGFWRRSDGATMCVLGYDYKWGHQVVHMTDDVVIPRNPLETLAEI